MAGAGWEDGTGTWMSGLLVERFLCTLSRPPLPRCSTVAWPWLASVFLEKPALSSWQCFAAICFGLWVLHSGEDGGRVGNYHL